MASAIDTAHLPTNMRASYAAGEDVAAEGGKEEAGGMAVALVELLAMARVERLLVVLAADGVTTVAGFQVCVCVCVCCVCCVRTCECEYLCAPFIGIKYVSVYWFLRLVLGYPDVMTTVFDCV